MGNKGQITIFIIIAILIVSVIALFFIFRNQTIEVKKIPTSIEPVYNNLLFCIEENILGGVDILESQGGYIELPEFEPGSSYMPFSNYLAFSGVNIPYWYYISGNNVQKEKIPTKSDMETQLSSFIEKRISKCKFDSYYEQGFVISYNEPEVKITINDNEIKADLIMDFSVEKDADNALIREHSVVIKSNLGKVYNSAKKVYQEEQEKLFLETYGVDTLRLYAPVDGVDISCSPKTWIADDVFEELKVAIESNTLALKTKGDDVLINKKENSYFLVSLPVKERVRFINSKNWTNSFEVAPAEGNLLISKPVGNQPGLGILGFCYVPYHFVYNVNYPVLIQIYDEETSDFFQFPVAVVIQGNKERKALETEGVGINSPQICEYKNTLVDLRVSDTKLNSLEADISYECFQDICQIGKTSIENANLFEFPQCANGYVSARAEGFEDKKILLSTTSESVADIIMDKLYTKEINLNLDGREYSGSAIISFISDKSSKTISYPEQTEIDLSEGEYEVQVYIYKNSSLKIQESTTEQCMEVPKTGFLGLFGGTEEKCFDIKIPEQIISDAISGGGKENLYILESELEDEKNININARSLPVPDSIEKLQENYILFDNRGLDIEFK